jgi:hypothetical protein
LQDIYSATVRFHGGDPTIGPRLRALLSDAGLEEVQLPTGSTRARVALGPDPVHPVRP